MNSYNLKARVYPVILAIVPAIIVGIVYLWHFKSYYQILVNSGITSILFFLFSQLGRDKGKSIEKEMWEKWGGAPTTQVLRYSNNTFDKHTKMRFHQKLKDLTNIGEKIDEAFEKIFPKKADEIYKSWTKYLISQTRDNQKYNLLFQENINYGFRRNIFGLKNIAISINIILIIGYFIYSSIISEYKVVLTPELILSVGIMGLILIFWIRIVNEKWVKTTAFAYAERLLEAIDIM